MITQFCDDEDLTFSHRAVRIAILLTSASTNQILDHLANAHVIPEAIAHDSTEEKLYAKYLDALLAKALAILGLSTEVITERADAADVTAKSTSYTLVGDAKAFRLSRTAKNQKDFKVGALNSWRNGAEFAVLCAPLYQFPTSKSQIYKQAIEYNVSLLSYTHLAFLIEAGVDSGESMKPLWQVGRDLNSGCDSRSYWAAMESTVCSISGKTSDDWRAYRLRMLSELPRLAEEQIAFWENEKSRIELLPHKTAVIELVKALKIESKISTIKKSGKI